MLTISRRVEPSAKTSVAAVARIARSLMACIVSSLLFMPGEKAGWRPGAKSLIYKEMERAPQCSRGHAVSVQTRNRESQRLSSELRDSLESELDLAEVGISRQHTPDVAFPHHNRSVNETRGLSLYRSRSFHALSKRSGSIGSITNEPSDGSDPCRSPVR